LSGLIFAPYPAEPAGAAGLGQPGLFD
jgi:hypothetical protein